MFLVLATGGVYLGGKELGGGLGVRIIRGDLDESVNIVLGNGLGDSLGALDMNIGISEVPEPLASASGVLPPGSHTWWDNHGRPG